MLQERRTSFARTQLQREQVRARSIAENLYEGCVNGNLTSQQALGAIETLKTDGEPAANYIMEFFKMLLNLNKRVEIHGRKGGESVYCTLESFRTKKDQGRNSRIL